MVQNRVDEVVQAIALETHTPAEAVLRLYEETLAQYSEGALIRDYLTVLVAKRVRQTLRQRDQAH